MSIHESRTAGLKLFGGLFAAGALLAGLYFGAGNAPSQTQAQAGPVAAPKAPLQMATFAGGCFWSIEGVFDDLPGVVSATSGFSGGSKPDPSYEDVSSGTTGHAESVRVVYDPAKVSYQKLLDVYWHQINPTVRNQQFYDVGTQYRTIIFYHNPQQKQLAMASKTALEKSHRFSGSIVTEIQPAGPFYAAEAYHQNYAHTHYAQYQSYRTASGRDAYFRSVWGSSGH